MKLDLDLKQAESMKDFIQRPDGSLVNYQPYFHQITPEKLHLRVVTPESNLKWLEGEVDKGKVQLISEIIIAEHI